MYGPLKLIGVFLSLVWPCLAYHDYYIPPTRSSIQRTKLRQHIEMDETLRRDGHYASEEIQTPSSSPVVPIISRSSNRQIHDQNMSAGYHRAEIVYPDQMKKTYCVHGLCYGTEGYPTDKIRTLLRHNEFAAGYFASEPEESVTLDNRFNTEEETLCETTVQSIFPEKANNTQQVEKLIVNVEGHKQGIVFETCASPKIQCKFHETFPQGYDTSCKQKYVKKKLMVYSEAEDEKFVFDTFEVPSCCVCVVKKMN